MPPMDGAITAKQSRKMVIRFEIRGRRRIGNSNAQRNVRRLQGMTRYPVVRLYLQVVIVLTSPDRTPAGFAAAKSTAELYPHLSAPHTKSHEVPCSAHCGEASNAPCDTGSNIETLREEFPENVDFQYLKSGWFVHEGEYTTDPKSLIARAAKLRRLTRNRPEAEVVLVTHGYFAHFLQEEVGEDGQQTTPWWGETGLRTFRLVDDGENATIEEWEETAAGRRTMDDGVKINDPKLR